MSSSNRPNNTGSTSSKDFHDGNHTTNNTNVNRSSSSRNNSSSSSSSNSRHEFNRYYPRLSLSPSKSPYDFDAMPTTTGIGIGSGTETANAAHGSLAPATFATGGPTTPTTEGNGGAALWSSPSPSAFASASAPNASPYETLRAEQEAFNDALHGFQALKENNDSGLASANTERPHTQEVDAIRASIDTDAASANKHGDNNPRSATMEQASSTSDEDAWLRQQKHLLNQWRQHPTKNNSNTAAAETAMATTRRDRAASTQDTNGGVAASFSVPSTTGCWISLDVASLAAKEKQVEEDRKLAASLSSEGVLEEQRDIAMAIALSRVAAATNHYGGCGGGASAAVYNTGSNEAAIHGGERHRFWNPSLSDCGPLFGTAGPDRAVPCREGSREELQRPMLAVTTTSGTAAAIASIIKDDEIQRRQLLHHQEDVNDNTGVYSNSNSNSNSNMLVQNYEDGGDPNNRNIGCDGRNNNTAATPTSAATSVVDPCVYIGEYDVLGRRHGPRGELIWDSGERYVGTFQNGMRSGQGVFFFRDGSEYAGDWQDNQMHGSGHQKFANGDTYVGQYHRGQRSGGPRCKLRFANGDLYVGGWKNDVFHGPGRYFFADGSVLEGNFVKGTKHGKFKRQLPTAEMDILRFEDDAIVGKGVRWNAKRTKTWLLILVEREPLHEPPPPPPRKHNHFHKHRGRGAAAAAAKVTATTKTTAASDDDDDDDDSVSSVVVQRKKKNPCRAAARRVIRGIGRIGSRRRLTRPVDSDDDVVLPSPPAGASSNTTSDTATIATEVGKRTKDTADDMAVPPASASVLSASSTSSSSSSSASVELLPSSSLPLNNLVPVFPQETIAMTKMVKKSGRIPIPQAVAIGYDCEIGTGPKRVEPIYVE